MVASSAIRAWLVFAGAAFILSAQQPDVKLLENLSWRFIGPAIMGGRATDVEGVPGDAKTVYAGFGTAGLWRTRNGGHTWTPLFETQNVYSIGDFALQPGNPDVIWVGTGESNTRNSVSFGDGVYKSTDGGKSWKHLGLRDSERISRVLIHPGNPNMVWVGALGRAYGKSAERGVFLTTDGGATWEKTLFIDEEHGVSDMDINPANPNIVYAAMWKFQRKPWTHTSGSEQGGVFRSKDGGRTWEKLFQGLPKLMGRVGVKVAPGNPNVVYVIAESKEGTLFRSDDGGDSFRKVTDKREVVSRGFYYADLRVDPVNENKVYAIATQLLVSIDGGKQWKPIVGGVHVDYHALWIDPQNPNRMWNGNDGGLAVTYDGGATWDPVYNIPLAQFYQIHADNRQPFYHIMGGLQDNGSWSGPSRNREPAGILNEEWTMVQFGDGFYMLNHPDHPELYLAESQGGMVGRTDMRTREQQMVSVQPLSPAGGPASAVKYRFNWNSPLIASPHDKNTVYLAGNVLFRSTDFGKTWVPISPDLTTNDPEKQKPAGGPVWYDNSTAEYHCTIISLAESPLRAGLLFAGTDDGRLHRSADGGKTWTELTGNIAGLPANSPVSHVEPSRRNADLIYAAFDRHMLDDFKPYIYRSENGGKTWAPIAGNLPEKAYVHVVREDAKAPAILYAGTELGLYVSYDGGRNWSFLKLKNLPPVPVHDIVVHPRENDLILGTHGRSIVILDDATVVQQFSPELANKDLHLFPPRPALRFKARFARYGLGGASFKGPNPPYGALIHFYLRNEAPEKDPPVVEILDAAGKVIRKLDKIPREKGVNRVAWDLRMDAPQPRKDQGDDEEDDGFGGGPRGPEVLPGTYTIRVKAAGKTEEQKMEVRLDPALNVTQTELRSRFDTALKLHSLIHRGNRTARALDSLAAQLDKNAAMLRQQSPDKHKKLEQTFKDYTKEVEKARDGFVLPPDVSRLEMGSRLLEKASTLFALVENVNAAPTAAQLETVNEVAPALEQQLKTAEAFLKRVISEWNSVLQKEGVPTLLLADIE